MLLGRSAYARLGRRSHRVWSEVPEQAVVINRVRAVWTMYSDRPDPIVALDGMLGMLLLHRLGEMR
jgi:hypothetical protein